MSDKALFSLLTALFLAVLAVWVPLLEAIAWLYRGRAADAQQQDRSVVRQKDADTVAQRSVA